MKKIRMLLLVTLAVINGGLIITSTINYRSDGDIQSIVTCSVINCASIVAGLSMLLWKPEQTRL